MTGKIRKDLHCKLINLKPVLFPCLLKNVIFHFGKYTVSTTFIPEAFCYVGN